VVADDRQLGRVDMHEEIGAARRIEPIEVLGLGCRR
jgi:hypothetical protein